MGVRLVTKEKFNFIQIWTRAGTWDAADDNGKGSRIRRRRNPGLFIVVGVFFTLPESEMGQNLPMPPLSASVAACPYLTLQHVCGRRRFRCFRFCPAGAAPRVYHSELIATGPAGPERL